MAPYALQCALRAPGLCLTALVRVAHALLAVAERGREAVLLQTHGKARVGDTHAPAGDSAWADDRETLLKRAASAEAHSAALEQQLREVRAERDDLAARLAAVHAATAPGVSPAFAASSLSHDTGTDPQLVSADRRTACVQTGDSVARTTPRVTALASESPIFLPRAAATARGDGSRARKRSLRKRRGSGQQRSEDGAKDTDDTRTSEGEPPRRGRQLSPPLAGKWPELAQVAKARNEAASPARRKVKRPSGPVQQPPPAAGDVLVYGLPHKADQRAVCGIVVSRDEERGQVEVSVPELGGDRSIIVPSATVTPLHHRHRNGEAAMSPPGPAETAAPVRGPPSHLRIPRPQKPQTSSPRACGTPPRRAPLSASIVPTDASLQASESFRLAAAALSSASAGKSSSEPKRIGYIDGAGDETATVGTTITSKSDAQRRSTPSSSAPLAKTQKPQAFMSCTSVVDDPATVDTSPPSPPTPARQESGCSTLADLVAAWVDSGWRFREKRKSTIVRTVSVDSIGSSVLRGTPTHKVVDDDADIIAAGGSSPTRLRRLGNTGHVSPSYLGQIDRADAASPSTSAVEATPLQNLCSQAGVPDLRGYTALSRSRAMSIDMSSDCASPYNPAHGRTRRLSTQITPLMMSHSSHPSSHPDSHGQPPRLARPGPPSLRLGGDDMSLRRGERLESAVSVGSTVMCAVMRRSSAVSCTSLMGRRCSIASNPGPSPAASSDYPRSGMTSPREQPTPHTHARTRGPGGLDVSPKFAMMQGFTFGRPEDAHSDMSVSGGSTPAASPLHTEDGPAGAKAVDAEPEAEGAQAGSAAGGDSSVQASPQTSSASPDNIGRKVRAQGSRRKSLLGNKALTRSTHSPKDSPKLVPDARADHTGAHHGE